MADAEIRVAGERGGICRSGRLVDGQVLAGLKPCAPASVLVREGCIHEHVFDVWLCEKHAGEDSHCAYCLRLEPGSHICKLIGKRLEPAP